MAVGARYRHRSEIVVSAIVGKFAILPPAALIAISVISEAVRDSAIEADLRGPVTGVKGVTIIDAAPIRRGPSEPRLRWVDPRSGYPEKIWHRFPPSPITRHPQIPIPWDSRLFVHRQDWGRYADLRSSGDGLARLEMRR